MYDKIFKFLNQFFTEATLFRVLFNISPMYKRSCGKLIYVSEDLHQVRIKIPLTYRNKNYVGSMYGGSLFSATDPIYMLQLLKILGNDYVVWDKATEIRFRRPAYQKAFALFQFSKEEIEDIKAKVNELGELDYVKKLFITDDSEKVIFTELDKTLYISTKSYYKEKMAKRK